MKKSFLLALVLAAGHLMLVICGAAGFSPDPQTAKANPAKLGLAYYGSLSGSENGYGFFAPGVAPELRAVFTLSDDQGNTWSDVLDKGVSAEADLRVGGIIGMCTH